MAGRLRWRLSIAEVAADGPFSRFDGLSRVLTVIEGEGLALHSPEGVLQARPLRPVSFSGDLAIDSRMEDGPVRDLNVIFDAALVDASVTVVTGPDALDAGQGTCAVLSLAGQVSVSGTPLPVGACALGALGQIELAEGAQGILVRLGDPG